MNKTDVIIALSDLIVNATNDDIAFERGYLKALTDAINTIKDLPDETSVDKKG